jgi:hypothetical protein
MTKLGGIFAARLTYALNKLSRFSFEVTPRHQTCTAV